MSDFESIELQIETSANGAEKNLDGIDKTLVDIQGSLKGITDILGNLDSKIAPISRSMNRLAGDIEKLNPDVFKRFGNSVKQSADDTEKATKRIESNLKTLSNDLKDSFNIDRKGTAELKQALTDFYNVQEKLAFADKMGDQRTFDEASRAADALKNKITEIVADYGRVRQAGIEAYKDLFETVKTYFSGGNKVYIPVEFVNEYLDGEARKMASAFGKSFTTNIEKDWTVTLTQMVEDIESAVNNAEFPQFGFLQGKLTGNAINDFKIIYDYAVSAKDEMLSMADAISKNALVAENFKTKIDETVSSIEQLAQAETDSFMQTGMDSYVSDMQTLEQETANVKESFDSMGESASIANDNLSKVGELSSKLQLIPNIIQEVNDAMVDMNDYIDRCFRQDIGGSKFVEDIKLLPAVIQTLNGSLSTVADGWRNLPATMGETGIALRNVIRIFTDDFKEASEDVRVQCRVIEEEFERMIDSINWKPIGHTETWGDTLREVELLGNDYNQLIQRMGEANAEIQILTDTQNKLNAAFNATRTGKMVIDIESMRKAQQILDDTSDKLNRFYNDIKNPFRLEVETSGIEKLNKGDTWENVLSDIEKLNNDFNILSQKMGEANAEMQILVDTRNRLKRAFSDTESGKMLWDDKSMRTAITMLAEVEDKINRVKASMKDPNRLEMDVSEPTSEIEKLYARLKELQSLMSDMQNLRINFDNDQFKETAQEIERVQERIKEIQGKGESAPDNDITKWMAQIIAIQHELEKASALFSRFGDIAKNAFLKALTPLKLFKHEFEEIKGLVTIVSRIGSAFAMISKSITKVFDNMRKKAEQSFEKIRKAWAKVMRTFTFMLIRKAITHIISTINDAITSLAAFSKSIGTDFNMSMSILTSDLRYIGASLTAAFAPILNAIIPTFDSLTDAIVGVINKVNMFLAVLTHAKSYTIAKKKLIDYTDAMEDANKKAKQLTMGIDELNILNDSQESNKNDEDKFDWLEIPTPTIDIPDWMKWIKELLQKLWDAIMGMLKALWNAIKDAWDRVKDFFIKAFKHLIESIVGLITDIIRDLTRLFNTEKFREFLERVFRIIAKIAELIATIIDRIREAWNYNDLGYRILEAILDILNTIAIHIENMLDAAIAWAKDLTFVPLFEAFLKLLQQVNYAIDQIGWVIEDVFETLFLPLLKLVIEDYLPRLILVLGNIVEGIGNIAKKFHEAWQETNFGERAVKAIDDIVQALLPHIEAVGESFKAWGNEIDFKPLLNSVIKLLKALEPIADMIGGIFEDIVNDYIEPVVEHIIEEVIPGIADAMAHFADTLDEGKLRQNIDKIIKAFASLSNAIGGGVVKALDSLGQKLAKFVNSKEFSDFIDTITGFVKKIDADMVAKVLDAIGTALLHMAQAVAKFGSSKTVKDFLDSIIKFMKTKSVEDIARIIEGIAKAFLLFKGLSFLTKTAANISGLLVPILKLCKTLGVGGTLAVALGAGALAFILFHDQIKAIDWNKLFKTVSDAIFNFVDKIDWKGVGEALAKVFIDIVKYALERAFNPEWQAMIGLELVKIVIEIIQGIGDGLLESIADWFHEMGWYGMEGFFRGFKDGWDAFWGAIAKFFQWLIDGVKKILGISSPSTVFYEIGGFVIQGLWDGIVAVWDAFWGWISGLWTDFVEWAKGIWQSIVDGIGTIWATLTGKIQEVWTLISEWFLETWDAFVLWAQELWQGLVDFIVNVWTTVTGALQAIWDGFWGWISETWATFTEWVNEIWTLVHDTITGWWDALILKVQEIWNGFWEWIFEAWNTFTEWVSGIWQGIHEIISNLWNGLIGGIKAAWSAFSKWINQKWTDFKNFATELWGKIKDFIVGVWQKIHDKAVEYWNKIKNKLNEVWTWAKEKAHTIFEDIRSFITEKWNKIHEKTTEIWSNIKSFLGELWGNLKDDAHSIFETMHQFLESVWNDIEMKWQTAWNATKNTVKDLWDKIETNAHGVFERAKAFLETVWDGMKNTWASAWENIHETVSSKWDMFKSTAKVKFGELQDSVSQKWEEIKIDAGSAWDKIHSNLKEKWNSLKDSARTIFKDLGKTVSDAWGDIKKAVGDTWDNISKFLDNLSEKTSKFADKVKSAIESFTKLQSESKQRVDHAGLGTDTYAEGGFPEKGSVYIAGEAGPELVGTINGRTAVANTQEITEAIEEAVGSAMDKVVAMMEKALDRMAENISDAMETFVDGNKQIIVELKTISANQTAIWKDARDFIGEVYSLITKLMAATQYEITQSNKELKDSYQTDDSAVSSALTRISSEYEMSNDDISSSIAELTEIVQSMLERTIQIITAVSERQISMQKQMVDYFKDAVNTLRTSIETNTNTKSVSPNTEVNVDTTEIVRVASDIYDTVQQGVDTFYTFADAWISVTQKYMELAKVFYEVGETIVKQLGSLNSSLYYIAKANDIDVPMYASGGFPEDGWFRASHGEIMGRFDNGQSVVANNSQITDGIAQAVSQSLVPILNDIADSSRATANKDMTLNVDSREIARANNNGQSKLGRSLISFT